MHANEHYGQKQMLENCELYIYASHWCQRLFYFNICTEVSLLVNVLHTPGAPTRKHISKPFCFTWLWVKSHMNLSLQSNDAIPSA